MPLCIDMTLNGSVDAPLDEYKYFVKLITLLCWKFSTYAFYVYSLLFVNNLGALNTFLRFIF